MLKKYSPEPEAKLEILFGETWFGSTVFVLSLPLIAIGIGLLLRFLISSFYCLLFSMTFCSLVLALGREDVREFLIGIANKIRSKPIWAVACISVLICVLTGFFWR